MAPIGAVATAVVPAAPSLAVLALVAAVWSACFPAPLDFSPFTLAAAPFPAVSGSLLALFASLFAAWRAAISSWRVWFVGGLAGGAVVDLRAETRSAMPPSMIPSILVMADAKISAGGGVVGAGGAGAATGGSASTGGANTPAARAATMLTRRTCPVPPMG